MPKLLKTVFHVHTDYSDDANTSPEQLLVDAGAAGVDCVAVTDHDAIEGAQHLASLAGSDLQIIVGQEVSTADGHLIGLFLRERIEPGLSARRTAEQIKQQGGLVVTPHPFNTLFGCSLRERVFDLIDLIDVVEVCNAQNLWSRPNRKAEAFAHRYAFLTLVGSDMHHRGWLDSCYQWIEPFEGPEAFLAALAEARFVQGRHPLSYFVRSANLCLRSRMGWPLPDAYGRNCIWQRPKLEPVPISVPADGRRPSRAR